MGISLLLRTRPGRAAARVALVCLLAASTAGCYNRYTLSQEEFASLQRPEEVPKVVTAESGKQVQVDRGTALEVRSLGGRRYPVTPFNFKMTDTQLVASDRDTLLMLNDLDAYDVKLLSTPKTALLISAGVAVVAGIIVATVLTAGKKSFADQ
ncbi:MAG: hypothetical protein H6744_21055 [Deltaproteobacteria bacterium]|nr:hypothetical protein [Deltaproteobacteria bacterium]MCB9789173.1 hypothetical protein [Deltaproteobacteria bacterium]